MAGAITVNVTKGRGGNWSAECSRDRHYEVGRSADVAIEKMRRHFRDKHPGFDVYVRVK